MPSNTDIRQTIKQARAKLDAGFQFAAGHAVRDQLMDLPAFQAAKNIACYLAYAGEVPTQPLIDYIWQQNKTCYLPVLKTTPEKHLTFHAYHQDAQLMPNQYNIDEPVATAEIAVTDLDLVLVPLVAFDKNCHRLGMGAGFYDRTFALRKQQETPLLIGLAYELQKVPELIPEDWDVAMDFVVTEKRVYSKSD